MTKMKTVKQLQNLARRSTTIATKSNRNRELDGLYWHTTTLYLLDDGRCYTQEHGGGAMRVDMAPKWLSRDEAIVWICKHATDPVTGYGYTEEQAAMMVAGEDAGKGYRKLCD